MKQLIKQILRFLRDRSASQLLEEGLLICIALFTLAVMLGVTRDITKFVVSFFDKTWKELQEIAKGLFGWA